MNESGNATTQTFTIDEVPVSTSLKMVLTAEREARMTMGKVSGVSRGGTAFRTEETIQELGQQSVAVESQGGHLQFTVDGAGNRLVDHKSADEGPARYSWSFMVKATWTGGSVTRSPEPGENKERGPGMPPPAEPEMPSEVSRPWATEAGGHIPEEDRKSATEGGPRQAPSTGRGSDQQDKGRPRVTK